MASLCNRYGVADLHAFEEVLGSRRSVPRPTRRQFDLCGMCFHACNPPQLTSSKEGTSLKDVPALDSSVVDYRMRTFSMSLGMGEGCAPSTVICALVRRATELQPSYGFVFPRR